MELTIISAYYDQSPREQIFLKRRIEHFHELRKTYPEFRMIIVDDGSMDFTLKDETKDLNLDNITLARVKEDLGFNSHGCRNLGMHLSKTEWNLLIDIDINLLSIDFDKIDLHNIIFINKNIFVIDKTRFWASKGYDEEFVNIHYGDEIFMKYLQKEYTAKEVSMRVQFYRRQRQCIISSLHNKTNYHDETERYFMQPKSTFLKLEYLHSFVQARYDSKDFSQKKVLNFDWEIIKD